MESSATLDPNSLVSLVEGTALRIEMIGWRLMTTIYTYPEPIAVMDTIPIRNGRLTSTPAVGCAQRADICRRRGPTGQI